MGLGAETGRPATLSEALGFSETVVEVGPAHPALRQVMAGVGGTTSFLVSLDDERIRDLEVEIGLGHRGFERRVECGVWEDALPYVSRLGHAGGVVAEVAYCLAVEQLAGIDLPDRAIWLRMLVCELARATEHFGRLAALATAIGLTAAEAAAREGELAAARLLAFATGGGPLEGWSRLGGVARALPPAFDSGWPGEWRVLLDGLARYERLSVRNPTCVERLRDVAPLSPETCFAWSVTGPSLRAAGVERDLRRDDPYLRYASLDFEIPIGSTGDDLDRLLVVIEEIRQSLRIVDQCRSLLASLGPGVLEAGAPGARAAVDGARGADPGEPGVPKIEVPAGEAWVAVEAPTGELGFHVVSDGEGLPRRIRCRAPSFFHAQALPVLLRGAALDDLLPTVALLHLVAAECDR